MPRGRRGIPSSESRSRFSKLYSGLQSQLILRSRLINKGLVNEPTLWELIGHNFPTDGFLDGPLRTVREREEWKRKVPRWVGFWAELDYIQAVLCRSQMYPSPLSL